MKSCLFTIGLLVLGCAISWGITCGLVALVCLCFDLTFSWLIATGVWAIACLLRSIFKQSSK